MSTASVLHTFNLYTSLSFLFFVGYLLGTLDTVLGHLLVDLGCHHPLQALFGGFSFVWDLQGKGSIHCRCCNGANVCVSWC